MPPDQCPPPTDPASPCIGICTINPQTQVCDGCYRTLDEISKWWDYSPEQKHKVLDQLDVRLQQIIDGNFSS